MQGATVGPFQLRAAFRRSEQVESSFQKMVKQLGGETGEWADIEEQCSRDDRRGTAACNRDVQLVLDPVESAPCKDSKTAFVQQPFIPACSELGKQAGSGFVADVPLVLVARVEDVGPAACVEVSNESGARNRKERPPENDAVLERPDGSHPGEGAQVAASQEIEQPRLGLIVAAVSDGDHARAEAARRLAKKSIADFARPSLGNLGPRAPARRRRCLDHRQWNLQITRECSQKLDLGGVLAGSKAVSDVYQMKAAL